MTNQTFEPEYDRWLRARHLDPAVVSTRDIGTQQLFRMGYEIERRNRRDRFSERTAAAMVQSAYPDDSHVDSLQAVREVSSSPTRLSIQREDHQPPFYRGCVNALAMVAGIVLLLLIAAGVRL